jgi:hypothetical protein
VFLIRKFSQLQTKIVEKNIWLLKVFIALIISKFNQLSNGTTFMCLRSIDPEFGGFSAQVSIFPYILLYLGGNIKS